MSEVAKLEPMTTQPVQQPAGDGAVILTMIDKLLTRPDVPVEKLEQMFALHQKMQAEASRREYDAAFARMQPELPEIDKKGKIIIKEKGTQTVIQSTPYALWDDTNRLIKPILAAHGFGLSFRITQTESRLTTTAVLSHTSGHRETTDFSSPIDSSGSKNNVQGWGSAFTYGKRYTGTAILNITTKGEDDDGKAAGAGGVISDEQREELTELITYTKTDIVKFLELGGVESLSEIPATQFQAAKAKLIAKRNHMQKAARNG